MEVGIRIGDRKYLNEYTPYWSVSLCTNMIEFAQEMLYVVTSELRYIIIIFSSEHNQFIH